MTEYTAEWWAKLLDRKITRLHAVVDETRKHLAVQPNRPGAAVQLLRRQMATIEEACQLAAAAIAAQDQDRIDMIAREAS